MKQFWLILGIGWILAIGIFIALFFYLFRTETITFTDDTEAEAPVVLSTDPVRGNLATGTIPIVTYSHFSCANCKALNTQLSTLLVKYPDQLIHIWKDLPNTVNPQSRKASIAGRCAQEQGAFWDYHDLLFKHQVSQEDDLYLAIAKELSLNTTKFERCFEKERTINLVTENAEEADVLDVISAPTLFIGDERFTGEVSTAELEAIILSN